MYPTILHPDSLLYIYYLEGRIAKELEIVNQNYLGTWEEDGFSFLFFTVPEADFVDQLIASQPSLVLLDTYEMTYEQWQGGRIEPLQIGNFLIIPPWFTPPEKEPSTVITLDPGVVFGNGLHPTTRDCLQAIEIACAGGKVESVLDLGCGTGILALAAAQRGGRRVVAVDFNYLACLTTVRNVHLNGLEDSVLVVNAQAAPFTHIPADLLVTNIHYDIMKDLIRTEGFLRQKWFVLSGLLASEAAKVEEYLLSQPVVILQKWQGDGTWHTLLGITSVS